MAVSFQQLDDNGSESDLLASNWTVTAVPAPDTVLLLGLGLSIIGCTTYEKVGLISNCR